MREHLEYPQLKRRVISEARKHSADVVLIEAAVSGISLAQDLRMDRIIRPICIRPRGDKITRMSAQSAKIAAGQVLIPETAAWLRDFEIEMLSFPESRHDDQVDSMSQFLLWVARDTFRAHRRWERPHSLRGPRRQRRRSGLYYNLGPLSFP